MKIMIYISIRQINANGFVVKIIFGISVDSSSRNTRHRSFFLPKSQSSVLPEQTNGKNSSYTRGNLNHKEFKPLSSDP